ncbi:MAG: orotidine-5'-phosphate decarboxylase [Chloroflexota bacterium]
MAALEKLLQAQDDKNSILCVGLDPETGKLPEGIEKSPRGILEFNKRLIEATSDVCCAYKLNFAFYERYGVEGFEILKRTFEAIPRRNFSIADAKRGDIGNTSRAYAASCFEYFGADSITVHAWMGTDSVSPFLEYKNKLVFALALTSNPGSADFQRVESREEPMWKILIHKTKRWAPPSQLGYVVGATHPEELAQAREIAPERALLIPGIGAQGGDLAKTLEANAGSPAVINSSRAIIYASSGSDFAERAREECEKFNREANK